MERVWLNIDLHQSMIFFKNLYLKYFFMFCLSWIFVVLMGSKVIPRSLSSIRLVNRIQTLNGSYNTIYCSSWWQVSRMHKNKFILKQWWIVCYIQKHAELQLIVGGKRFVDTPCPSPYTINVIGFILSCHTSNWYGTSYFFCGSRSQQDVMPIWDHWTEF